MKLLTKIINVHLFYRISNTSYPMFSAGLDRIHWESSKYQNGFFFIYESFSPYLARTHVLFFLSNRENMEISVSLEWMVNR